MDHTWVGGRGSVWFWTSTLRCLVHIDDFRAGVQRVTYTRVRVWSQQTAAVERRGWSGRGLANSQLVGIATEEGTGYMENPGGFFLASMTYFDRMEKFLFPRSSFPSFNYLSKATSLQKSTSPSNGRYGEKRKNFMFFKIR